MFFKGVYYGVITILADSDSNDQMVPATKLLLKVSLSMLVFVVLLRQSCGVF
jgi:hypothetical protein